MKILLVTEDVPAKHLGGAGRHAITLGNALIDAGHEVEMLGLAHGADAGETNGFNGPLHRKLGFGRTGWQEHRFGTFLPYRRHHIGQRIAASIAELGVRNYDVIHYHGHAVETGLFMADGVNYLHTLHDQGSECLRFIRFVEGARCTETVPERCVRCANADPNQLQRWLTAKAVDVHRDAAHTVFRRHKAIFVSEFLRQRFIANTNSDGKFNARVIHNFIAPQKALPEVDLNEDLPRVLMSGRVDVYKGFVDLLDEVDDELLSRFEWRIAGDGPQMPVLRERHGHRRIRLLGFVSQAEVMAETSAAALTIVPSVWDEPCATAILEALGHGVPVWTLNRGGSPELLRYRAYEGQMRIFDNLADMVAALREMRLVRQKPVPNPAVTINRRLPEILEYYGQ